VTIAVRNVSKVFRARGSAAGGGTHAVRGASFELRPGQTLGLVGESGSGKSTLARIVLGLLPPTSGHVEFDGTATDRFGPPEWAGFRRQVQAVFQDPRQSLNWRLTIASIVTEPLRNYGIGDSRTRRARAAELLEQVHVSPKLLARRPPEVSGGQLQRVAIARALALEPSYLVCDEPLSALDVSVQAGIINLFLDLQESRGLAMLFISHDLAVVRHLSDQVVVMRRGEIVEQATADDFYRRPRHPYSRELLGLPPDPGPGPDPDPDSDSGPGPDPGAAAESASREMSTAPEKGA
jgi:peptide/nickel transport system ATP-binding protein